MQTKLTDHEHDWVMHPSDGGTYWKCFICGEIRYEKPKEEQWNIK